MRIFVFLAVVVLVGVALASVLRTTGDQAEPAPEPEPIEHPAETVASGRGEGSVYRVFYCFYGEGVEVPSHKPIPMEQADIYSDLFGRLVSDEDFLGMLDEAGRTLQFMYHAGDDHYWVEIPRSDLNGSYGRYMTFDEATDLLKALPPSFTPESVPGLRFQEW